MDIWTVLLILLVLAALALMGAAAYFFRFAHRRVKAVPAGLEREGETWRAYREMTEEGMAWMATRPCEQVTVTSHDGLKLAGTYIPAENPRVCVILFHGYRSWGLRDYGGLLPFYGENGLSMVVVDQRACGESEGEYITFGVKERLDAQTWARAMDRRFEGKMPLILDGISMGATTVMMAADLDLPESVVGLIADCGFTSPYDIIAHVGRTGFHIPAFPLIDLLSLTAKVKAGFSYRECDTRRTLAKNRLPIFFLHGGDDDFVPTWMSEANYAAAGGWKRKLIIPGAGHGLSYMVDRPACQRALMEFMDVALKGDAYGQ